MKIDCIIGIDPGSNGGIVVWRPNHNATAIKMPKDINEIKGFSQLLQRDLHADCLFGKIER